jgi:adenylate cyclase
MELPVERRLAAILAADVVGYSRLMGVDEAGTLAALRSLRKELVEPTLNRHRGRIVKLMGDGLLVEFASVVDAVTAALEIQEQTPARSANLPEDRRIALRIGVNLGDVVVEDGDLFGDGVNIAARLQEVAEPDGVAISGDAYRHLRGKSDRTFEDAGEISLKNIAEPVRTWPWSATGEQMGAAENRPQLMLPEKPSIAVLPFTNLSSDPEQEFFADGISEDIITALSRVRQMFVIARNTTFTYKGKAVDVSTVAKELGVRYVLEGSVRKGGNRVRITTQLIEGVSGNHIWAERYDRDLDDIFEVQDEITQTVLGQMSSELSRAEQERARLKPPENLDAWDLYHRGLWHVWRFTKDDNESARQLFTQAIERDPNFSAAYALLTYAHFQLFSAGFELGNNEVNKVACLAAARKAVACDDRDPLAHWALGGAYIMQHDYPPAIDALQIALRLNPSLAWGHFWLALAFALSGEAEKAFTSLDLAERLSPNDAMGWAMLAVRSSAYAILEDHEEVEKWARRAMQRQPTIMRPYVTLLACLGHLGRAADAKLIADDLQRLHPGFLETWSPDQHWYGHQGFTRYLNEGFQKAKALID